MAWKRRRWIMTADLSGSNSLADLATRTRGKAAADGLNVEHAMAAGDLLIEAKPEVHGQWLPPPRLVVGSNAARAPPQKKTSLRGSGVSSVLSKTTYPGDNPHE
jgi:hypothetical protein